MGRLRSGWAALALAVAIVACDGNNPAPRAPITTASAEIAPGDAARAGRLLEWMAPWTAEMFSLFEGARDPELVQSMIEQGAVLRIPEAERILVGLANSVERGKLTRTEAARSLVHYLSQWTNHHPSEARAALGG